MIENEYLPISPTETLYFFGGNNMTEWTSLFQHYKSPPYVLPHTSGAYSFGIAGQRGDVFSAFSRNFGWFSDCWFKCIRLRSVTLLPPGPGTGVPFHWHGPGFAEVIYGKKVNDELFLQLFRFSTTQTCRQTLALLKDHLFHQRWFFYPPEQEPHFDRNHTTLSWVTRVYPNLPEDEAPLECTLRPGEVTTQVFIIRALLQHLKTDEGQISQDKDDDDEDDVGKPQWAPALLLLD